MSRKAPVVTAFLLSLALPLAVQAEPKYLEDAVEAGGIELLVDQHGKGEVIASDCDGCPQRFDVTPQTRYQFGRGVITLDQARRHSRKPGTVIFDVETRNVTGVYWFGN